MATSEKTLRPQHVLQVGKARTAELSVQQLRAEQRAWRAKQRQKQLHEQHTRIILDDTGNIVPHRSHDLPLDTSQATEEKEPIELRREGELAGLQSSAFLAERYELMKAGLREETAALRTILVSSEHTTTPLPAVEGEMLPPTTSPLLGTFSPHLVSHHLPTLFSYPVFHFGRDAFQPHLACCFTLNQAQQLIHRVNQQLSSSPLSSSPTSSTSPPLSSYLYAYHIGSGIGRLASHTDGPHPGAGERLLYQLQSTHTTNAIVLVTCPSIDQTVSGGGVGRQAEVARDRVRCVVRVAKGLLREWKRCVEELKAEETAVVKNAGEEEKDGGWEQENGPTLVPGDSQRDASVNTFITQSPVGEAETDGAETEEVVEGEVNCALPHSPPLIPRLTHTARLNHYLDTLSSSLPALVPPPPPRTTPTAVYWALPSLRADFLATLFPTVQPTSTSAFLSSASLLAVRWQLLPCLEHEREWMVSEQVWEGVRDWLEKETTADRLREQWVEGGWSLVRRSMWDVYIRQMKFMHSTYQQADMEAMAALDNPPLVLRLLLLAVGGVLGWPQLPWVDVVPYLTGLRAVPPQDIFAEFPPPPGPPSSVPSSPRSSIASFTQQRTSSLHPSPYEHSHVITNPLLSDPSSASDATGDNDAASSDTPSQSVATRVSLYASYRSDLLAHLLSFDLFTMSSSALQRVQSVLCEHALAPSELAALDRQAPGSRWLVQWLVLVMRCSRLWQLSRQVLMVQVEEVEQAASAARSTTAGSERKNRRAVRVGDVEIEHDSGEDEEEAGGSVPGSAFTDRGWTASRAASAL